MKRSTKRIFLTVKVLFTLLVIMGAGQYFFNHDVVVEMFTQIHFPTYLIYPMGAAKFLGLIAIWFSKSSTLREWAYAGYTFNFLLAISAHLNVNDGEFYGGLIALIFVSATYVLERKVNESTASVAVS